MNAAQELRDNIERKYGFLTKTKTCIVAKEGKWLKTVKNSSTKQGKAKMQNYFTEANDCACEKYRKHFRHAYDFGLNGTNTVTRPLNILDEVEDERDTDFKNYSVTDLCFTEDFKQEVDKRVALSIKEICHIGEDEDAENTLGINSITNKSRSFTFTSYYGRDCFDKLRLRERNFHVHQVYVYDYLYRKGVKSKDTKKYAPWVYSVYKSMIETKNCISLELFGAFIDDLQKYYLDIQSKGLNSQEYLMRRVEGYVAGMLNHEDISLSPTDKMFRCSTFTIKVWDFDTEDWWLLKQSKQGNLRTFTSITECVSEYTQNEVEYTTTMRFIRTFSETTNYSIEYILTLALLYLYKTRYKANLSNQALTTFIQQQMGLSDNQVKGMSKDILRSINIAGLKLLVVPEYKQQCYLNFVDLNHQHPEVNHTVLKQNMVELLKGATLDYICNP